jgi:hypothetical protein
VAPVVGYVYRNNVRAVLPQAAHAGFANTLRATGDNRDAPLQTERNVCAHAAMLAAWWRMCLI